MQKQIANGQIHGGSFIFKFQDDKKFRYYCSQQKNGCRAALYLELTEGSKGACFISHEQHSNHKESIKKYQKIDESDLVNQKIWEYDNLNLNPESIKHKLIQLGLNPP
ncbi:hypothetical protein BpHYR1_024588 [Brachionus plicatilis]|uniref:FLYWCH-type domain-containing protein n=1 Tax=Brachionus plicatilis TaxID=10195 RepID=A0A3M7PQA7_BRAPC|nr:hypothetical protein BpHYR1_024588 [Brachionus plicatilis]